MAIYIDNMAIFSYNIAKQGKSGGENLNNIRAIRKRKRIYQKDLAAAANISQPFLHDLEKGNRNAKIETLQRIAEALNCTVDDLLATKGD